MALKTYRAVGVLIAALSSAACASPGGRASEEVQATFEAFYGAMKAGDAPAAMRLVAPDAIFLESGRLETRAAYESSHLPADIEFESQVTGKRGPITVTVEGDTAWAIAMTDYDGVFKGSNVNFTGAQLMVLTRIAGEWRIRSIHWSSLRR